MQPEMISRLAAAQGKFFASWICVAENVYPGLIPATTGGHRLR
jgi:hypothetical protein